MFFRTHDGYPRVGGYGAWGLGSFARKLGSWKLGEGGGWFGSRVYVRKGVELFAFLGLFTEFSVLIYHVIVPKRLLRFFPFFPSPISTLSTLHFGTLSQHHHHE